MSHLPAWPISPCSVVDVDFYVLFGIVTKPYDHYAHEQDTGTWEDGLEAIEAFDWSASVVRPASDNATSDESDEADICQDDEHQDACEDTNMDLYEDYRSPSVDLIVPEQVKSPSGVSNPRILVPDIIITEASPTPLSSSGMTNESDDEALEEMEVTSHSSGAVFLEVPEQCGTIKRTLKLYDLEEDTKEHKDVHRLDEILLGQLGKAVTHDMLGQTTVCSKTIVDSHELEPDLTLHDQVVEVAKGPFSMEDVVGPTALNEEAVFNLPNSDLAMVARSTHRHPAQCLRPTNDAAADFPATCISVPPVDDDGLNLTSDSSFTYTNNPTSPPEVQDQWDILLQEAAAAAEPTPAPQLIPSNVSAQEETFSASASASTSPAQDAKPPTPPSEETEQPDAISPNTPTTLPQPTAPNPPKRPLPKNPTSPPASPARKKAKKSTPVRPSATTQPSPKRTRAGTRCNGKKVTRPDLTHNGNAKREEDVKNDNDDDEEDEVRPPFPFPFPCSWLATLTERTVLTHHPAPLFAPDNTSCDPNRRLRERCFLLPLCF
jgi:hypothetical protein